MADRGVPVTILTGYLGSGKTTLLKKIISSSKERIAILMNEFGEIGVDTKTVRGKDVEIKELLGGCVCCSLTGEFEAAIAEILKKVKPDRIVVETTGVAEPDAMITNLDGVEGVYLDSVVTLVDADAFLKFPKLGHTGRVQIESADVIVLNKLDLVNAGDIGKVERAIRELNPGARMFRTTYSGVGNDSIFGIESGRKPIGEKKVHKPSFTDSFVYRTDRMLSRSRFLGLVSNMPQEIYRAKGHVRFTDGVYLFNFVNGRHEVTKSGDDGTEIVFIGEGLGGVKEELMRELARCEM